VVTVLLRMLRDDAQKGVARDPSSVARFQAEIDQNEHDLKIFRQQAEELRKLIEFARAQVGFGDERYRKDNDARYSFRDLLDSEAQLVVAGQAGPKAQGYGQRVQPLLMQARAEEDKLVVAFKALDAQVDRRTKELQAQIDTYRAQIAGYTGQLDTLDNGQDGAHDLVGKVAKQNFEGVRKDLRLLVLEADVGITTQAWEVREEEMSRVHNLQTERAREEQLLDEEQKEVLDDANNTSSGAQ
jgi:hypothetical protein